MQRLYFARFLCAYWVLLGFFGFFICWAIELKNGNDMSSFRSTEVILILICLSLVWLVLHTIIQKYDKGSPPVIKTKKEKLVEMCVYYFFILTVFVPILCYFLGIRGWEFMLIEFVSFIMLSITGNFYNMRNLSHEDEGGSEEKFH